MRISRTYALVAATVAALVVGIVTTDCGTSTTCLRYSDCGDGLTCADGLCVVPPPECGEAGPCATDAGAGEGDATVTTDEDGSVELSDAGTTTSTTDASGGDDAGDAGTTTVVDASSDADAAADAGIQDASAD